MQHRSQTSTDRAHHAVAAAGTAGSPTRTTRDGATSQRPPTGGAHRARRTGGAHRASSTRGAHRAPGRRQGAHRAPADHLGESVRLAAANAAGEARRAAAAAPQAAVLTGLGLAVAALGATGTSVLADPPEARLPGPPSNAGADPPSDAGADPPSDAGAGVDPPSDAGPDGRATDTFADAEPPDPGDRSASTPARTGQEPPVAQAQAERRTAVTGRVSRGTARSGAVRQPAWVMPIMGARLTSCFGLRGGVVHEGVDLAAPAGTPVRAAGAGVVVATGWNYPGYGISIVLDHGGGIRTHYAHLSQSRVRVGQRVKVGQMIGREGSTGDSTGPHLHFEVHQGAWRQVDPARWLRARGIRIGC